MKPTQRIGAMLLISSMLLTGVSVAEEPSNPPAATEASVTTAPTEAPTATPAPENPTEALNDGVLTLVERAGQLGIFRDLCRQLVLQ